jgi:protein involved in polysaccharide export with SLBB domain
MPFADVASFCAKYPATPGCPAAGAGETANGQGEQLGARAQAEPGNGVDGEPLEARPNQATARRPKSILVRSEFELFAEDAAGRPLPVYGRQLFDEGPTTFAPLDRVPVPEDYVVGPGDQLEIRVWGKVEINTRATVDRNGQIAVPRVGTLTVAGLKSGELEGFLKAAFGNLFKDFELNVTLGQLRSIQVFVLGSARQPGVYTVSSLSTLVNALFACGGPSATGSMRRIELRRSGRLVTELDMYAFLRNGDKSHDAQLLPGDVIFIPPVGPEVALLGSVNDAGIYELKGETTVASALDNAGGLASLAGTDRVLLERIENHRRRRVDEFSLDAAGLGRVLGDGDLLRIFPISPRFENAVTLRGNVTVPGRFTWREGMRVADLIPSRESLITRDYWNRQNHLTPVGAPREFQKPVDGKDMGLDQKVDAMIGIGEASAEINWEYAVIERLDQRDLSTRLIAFNLGQAIDQPAGEDNKALEAGDVITVFARKDLELPLDKHASFVRVGGEVNAPGLYRVKPGETLRELVERAGGLTPHSYLFAAQLNRVSARMAEEEQVKLSIRRLENDMAGRMASSGISAINQQQATAQQAMITALSAYAPTGRVVLKIEQNATTVAEIPDLPLEDGDTLYIPPRLGTVQVVGSVYNENAFRYQGKRPVLAYLNDAGGATRDADVKRIFLVRADGEVISRQSHGGWQGNFEKISPLPGDAIVVPPRLKGPNPFLQMLPGMTQSLSQAAFQGAIQGLIP